MDVLVRKVGAPRVVVGKVLEKSGNFGFDAQEEVYGNLVEKGIVDPTKVVRIALQNAASVAGLLIVRHQHSLDRIGEMRKGGFLAHRSHTRSADETRNPGHRTDPNRLSKTSAGRCGSIIRPKTRSGSY
jgi:hypothetical protein